MIFFKFKTLCFNVSFITSKFANIGFDDLYLFKEPPIFHWSFVLLLVSELKEHLLEFEREKKNRTRQRSCKSWQVPGRKKARTSCFLS